MSRNGTNFGCRTIFGRCGTSLGSGCALWAFRAAVPEGSAPGQRHRRGAAARRAALAGRFELSVRHRGAAFEGACLRLCVGGEELAPGTRGARFLLSRHGARVWLLDFVRPCLARETCCGRCGRGPAGFVMRRCTTACTRAAPMRCEKSASRQFSCCVPPALPRRGSGFSIPAIWKRCCGERIWRRFARQGHFWRTPAKRSRRLTAFLGCCWAGRRGL